MSDQAPVKSSKFRILVILIARVRFLAVFLAVGFLVGYWDSIVNHYDKWRRPAATGTLAEGATVKYTCAMHPNIIRDEPGSCPLCGMTLIPRQMGKSEALPEDVLSRVRLTPRQLTLGGIATSPVEKRPLVREIHAVGFLDYAEPNVYQITARVRGRVEEVFIPSVGKSVKKGERLYSIYSPEIYSAQREYLLARQRVNKLPNDAYPQLKTDASTLYNATMEKLVLWGASRDQLNLIDQEYDATGKFPDRMTLTSPIDGIVTKKEIYPGSTLDAGMPSLTIADLDPLWLKIKLYERDIPLVEVGQSARVNVEGAQTLHGIVNFKALELDPKTRTLDVRVAVENPDLKLLPGMFGDAVLLAPIVKVAGVAPQSQPVANPSLAYANSLALYLQAQGKLAGDDPKDVAALLRNMNQSIAAIDDAASRKIAEKLPSADEKEIAKIRESFKTVSAEVIALGHRVGLPETSPTLKVFRCPMANADWIQKPGDTNNPYYGAEMIDCGAAVEDLPRVSQTPPSSNFNAAPVLVVPRSAVIETGKRRLVYVQSADGVFDLREVRLGAGDDQYYCVESGLKEGDRVVSVGAFLIDSENRLNPAAEAK